MSVNHYLPQSSDNFNNNNLNSNSFNNDNSNNNLNSDSFNNNPNNNLNNNPNNNLNSNSYINNCSIDNCYVNDIFSTLRYVIIQNINKLYSQDSFESKMKETINFFINRYKIKSVCYCFCLFTNNLSYVRQSCCDRLYNHLINDTSCGDRYSDDHLIKDTSCGNDIIDSVDDCYSDDHLKDTNNGNNSVDDDYLKDASDDSNDFQCIKKQLIKFIDNGFDLNKNLEINFTRFQPYPLILAIIRENLNLINFFVENGAIITEYILKFIIGKCMNHQNIIKHVLYLYLEINKNNLENKKILFNILNHKLFNHITKERRIHLEKIFSVVKELELCDNVNISKISLLNSNRYNRNNIHNNNTFNNNNNNQSNQSNQSNNNNNTFNNNDNNNNQSNLSTQSNQHNLSTQSNQFNPPIQLNLSNNNTFNNNDNNDHYEYKFIINKSDQIFETLIKYSDLKKYVDCHELVCKLSKDETYYGKIKILLDLDLDIVQLINNKISNNKISDTRLSNNQLQNIQLQNNQTSNNEISDNEPSNNKISDTRLSSNNQILNNLSNIQYHRDNNPLYIASLKNNKNIVNLLLARNINIDSISREMFDEIVNIGNYCVAREINFRKIAPFNCPIIYNSYRVGRNNILLNNIDYDGPRDYNVNNSFSNNTRNNFDNGFSNNFINNTNNSFINNTNNSSLYNTIVNALHGPRLYNTISNFFNGFSLHNINNDSKYILETKNNSDLLKEIMLLKRIESECPICYENNNCIILNCDHSFCENCLIKSIDFELKKCSLCRKDIFD